MAEVLGSHNESNKKEDKKRPTLSDNSSTRFFVFPYAADLLIVSSAVAVQTAAVRPSIHIPRLRSMSALFTSESYENGYFCTSPDMWTKKHSCALTNHNRRAWARRMKYFNELILSPPFIECKSIFQMYSIFMHVLWNCCLGLFWYLLNHYLHSHICWF